MNRFDIVFCELFNKHYHGITEDSSKNVERHYLVNIRAVQEELKDVENTKKFIMWRYANYLCLPKFMRQHTYIRNYDNIMRRRQTYQPQIAECVYLLPGEECVAIIKTFWLKWIQRAWKKTYSQRQAVLKERKSVVALKTKEITGMWPGHCSRLPGLKGMLYNKKYLTAR